jgi:hypothetical protein
MPVAICGQLFSVEQIIATNSHHSLFGMLAMMVTLILTIGAQYHLEDGQNQVLNNIKEQQRFAE